MSGSNKVTKSESTIIHGCPQKIFQGGNVEILFIIFKLLTISVPSKIFLNWVNICFSEHDCFKDAFSTTSREKRDTMARIGSPRHMHNRK